eukprot:9308966-Alexandrium_andersonii.AAC.1
MRWVLTWKPSPEDPRGRRAKARIVILGFQHPELEKLKVASPTLSRAGRMLTFQWAALHRAELVCADIKSAFLQGDRDDNPQGGV